MMSRKSVAVLAIAALFAGACLAQSGESGGADAAPGGRAGQSDDARRTSGIDLRVQNYASGHCALVSVAGSGHRDPLVDSCHGWRVSSCRGVMLVVSDEPRLAHASIVRDRPAGDDRAGIEIVDLDEAILRKLLSTRRQRQDIIALSFGNISCTATGVEVAYDGSFMEADVSGPGIGMRGTIVVSSDGVSIRM